MRVRLLFSMKRLNLPERCLFQSWYRGRRPQSWADVTPLMDDRHEQARCQDSLQEQFTRRIFILSQVGCSTRVH